MNSLGTPIAVGRTAEIYAWSDRFILKLIRPGFPAYLADQEWKYADAAWRLGARAPKPVEILDVEGRRGVVFQRLDGSTLSRHMQRSLHRLGEYARLLARLHVELHSLSVPSFPSQSERIRRNLEGSEYLPAELKPPLLQLLDGLPEDDRLCHGDFHPENLILTRDGPLIIDWESSMRGCPAADVARTCLWMRTALQFDPGLRGWLKRRLGMWLERAYRAEYERAAPGRLDRLEEWITLQAASRLQEGNRDQMKNLLPIIQKGAAAIPS